MRQRPRSLSPGRRGAREGPARPVLPVNARALAARHPAAWRRILDGLPGAGDATRERCGPLPQLPPDLDEAEEVVVFGFGDGTLPGEVLGHVSPGARVTVAVLDPGPFLAALRERDLRPVLEDPRLVLAAGGLGEIAALLPRNPGEAFRVVVLPGAPVPPGLEPLAAMGRELAAAQGSLLRQRGEVLDNIAANLPAIARAEPAAALLPWVAGRAALLVAPGPGLADVLPLLASRRDRLPLLVALDAALRPLAEAGVRPDLVVTLDPLPATVDKFRPRETAAPGPGAGEWLHGELPLVFFEGARPEAVAAAGRPLFACERGGLLDRAHPAFGRAGTFRSGGTVLLAALDLLLALGAGPVGLVGADLALAPDGAYAADGARPGAARGRRLEVEGLDGGLLPATETLWRHRRRLLRRAGQEPPGRVVDLRTRGAALPGIPREPLTAWLDRFRGQGPGAGIPERPVPVAVPVLPPAEREEALAAAREALAAAAAGGAGPRDPA